MGRSRNVAPSERTVIRPAEASLARADVRNALDRAETTPTMRKPLGEDPRITCSRPWRTSPGLNHGLCLPSKSPRRGQGGGHPKADFHIVALGVEPRLI